MRERTKHVLDIKPEKEVAEETLENQLNDWGRSWERGRNRSEEGDETFDPLNEQAKDCQEDEEQEQKTLHS